MGSLSFLAVAAFGLVFLLQSQAHASNGALPGDMQRTTPYRKWMLFRRDLIGFDRCKTSDIVVSQAVGSRLPNGIPTFLVQICSTCRSDCRVSDVHVSCGQFASVKMVNPRVFRRVGPDDCLVNDGKPLESGVMLSFVYANSFSYPLRVSRASIC